MRQPRHPQDPRHPAVAGPPPPLPPALHADRLILDQPGRAVVRLLDRPDDPPRRAQERAGPRSRHPRLDQELEPEPPALHLDQNRGRDPGFTGKIYSKDFGRGILERNLGQAAGLSPPPAGQPAAPGRMATLMTPPMTAGRALITHWRYRLLPIMRYYRSMAISDGEYLVTTARDLGAALKHFRTAAGVTQTDAAEAMGIGQPYLSSLEGRKIRQLADARAAAAALRRLRGRRPPEGAPWLTGSWRGSMTRQSRY